MLKLAPETGLLFFSKTSIQMALLREIGTKRTQLWYPAVASHHYDTSQLYFLAFDRHVNIRKICTFKLISLE